MSRRNVWTFLGMWIVAAAAAAADTRAASFDCAPFRSGRQCPEMVICANSELSRLDSRLALTYSDLLDRLSKTAAGRLRREHQGWLARRNDCGCDVSCIWSQYDQRLRDLALY